MIPCHGITWRRMTSSFEGAVRFFSHCGEKASSNLASIMGTTPQRKGDPPGSTWRFHGQRIDLKRLTKIPYQPMESRKKSIRRENQWILRTWRRALGRGEGNGTKVVNECAS